MNFFVSQLYAGKSLPKIFFKYLIFKKQPNFNSEFIKQFSKNLLNENISKKPFERNYFTEQLGSLTFYNVLKIMLTIEILTNENCS